MMRFKYAKFPISKMLVLSALLILSMVALANNCNGDPSLSCSAIETEIEIGEPLINTETRDLRNFFGLHVFFWSMQSDLYANTPSKVSSSASSILKQSGVGFLRYGGGVNEIDWHGCVGWIMERPKQQLVDWAGPMRCIFGLAEYEKLNDELNLSSSWHIANVVGFEGKSRDITLLAKDAGERAKLIKELAGSRLRYWELGNEIDRDKYRWNAEKIASRDLLVAQAILDNDPSAKLILPLLEYKPDWVVNANEHNRSLIRKHKAMVNNYALHLYYENAPWGPSVVNRLASVRNIAGLISQEGIANPSIWVTEHARTPPGTPEDKNWNKTWYQTGNHDAVIATADFLIGLSQIPIVKGAAWHGLRTGPWNFMDLDNDKNPQETRMSRLFELLKPSLNYQTLSTKTNSAVDSNLSESYAVRATAFLDKSDPNKFRNVVWLVNRSNSEKKVRLNNRNFRKYSSVDIKQVSFSEAYDPADSISTLPVVSNEIKPIDGVVAINLPERSVVLVSISATNS